MLRKKCLPCQFCKIPSISHCSGPKTVHPEGNSGWGKTASILCFGFTGPKINKIYKMEKGVIYNVAKGEWHGIVVSSDALVMVVENSDTTEENSDYIYLA